MGLQVFIQVKASQVTVNKMQNCLIYFENWKNTIFDPVTSIGHVEVKHFNISKCESLIDFES